MGGMAINNPDIDPFFRNLPDGPDMHSPAVDEARKQQQEKIDDINSARDILEGQAVEVGRAGFALAEHLSQLLDQRLAELNIDKDNITEDQIRNDETLRRLWPSQEVVKSNYEITDIETNPLKFIKNSLFGKYDAEVSEDEHGIEGRGWRVSIASTNKGTNTHAIYLLEDGRLVMGRPYPDNTRGGRTKDRKINNPHGKYSGNTAEYEGELRLNYMPRITHITGYDNQPTDTSDVLVHPFFCQPRGYAETMGVMPAVVQTMGPARIPLASQEAYVGINIERLEKDLKESGRCLLGIS